MPGLVRGKDGIVGALLAGVADINGVANPTVTGLISGTLTYNHCAVAGVAAANSGLCIRYHPPIPASAPNVAIAVSCPSLGAGNTGNAVNAYGFYL